MIIVGLLPGCHRPRRRTIQYSELSRLSQRARRTGYPAVAGYDGERLVGDVIVREGGRSSIPSYRGYLKGRGVLDTPPSGGMTANGLWLDERGMMLNSG
jgi:hypothetical protein